MRYESAEDAAPLTTPFAPAFRLIYTPNFRPADMPGQQAIVVDLDNYVTYIMGPDYFGESKKGALRMLCEFIYRRGGLVMHAGAKTIELEVVTIGEDGVTEEDILVHDDATPEEAARHLY